ncbi:scopoletin glucosyltransferase-like protein [Tanacetum coccineum]
MTDMAVLFASRGVQATIITTRETTRLFTKSIQKTKNYTYQITLHIIESRAAKAGLPPGLENSDKPVPSQYLTSFFDVISMLQEPFEQFIQQAQPNCIVADMFYPWTTKIAAKYNIPRIVFNGTGFFPLCVVEAMRVYDPARDVSSDSEPFIVPHLPHKIMSTKKQLARIEEIKVEGFVKVMIQASEAEVTSYGVVINSFYELEPEYARHYREVVKKKAWHIGPVSLCSKNKEDTLERGEKSGISGQECLRWLDSKAHDSVVYVGFGTMVTVTSSQLYEIAMGLEACDNDFIWVIKNEEESSFPEGFEARLKEKGKGLIIKGWAPQVLILDHGSVGGFVTHCGWNSVLEGVAGGVAMVAWPVMAEQFFNAKLVTDVLEIGVSIGDVEWSATSTCEGVKRETIANAVARLMDMEGGLEMRR